MTYKRITSAVVALHLLIVMIFLFSPQPRAKKQPQHIAVRTQISHPKAAPKSAAPSRPSSGRPPSAQPKKKKPVEAPVARAAPKKKSPKKTAVVEPGKKVKAQKPAPPPEEFAAEIAPKPEKRYSGPQLDVPKPIGALEMDRSELAVFENAVGGPEKALASFLEGSLNLPEPGAVSIEVTFGSDGSVAKVVVIHSGSAKNRAYLEKNLPLQKFPNLEELKSRTLTLTFYNNVDYVK